MDAAKEIASPAIFDSHAHLYSPSIISSVARREGLARELGLALDGALGRTDKEVLKKEAARAGVRGCLLLPIAPPNGVHAVNQQFVSAAEGEDLLLTAGTLHPASDGIEQELEWLAAKGVRTLKLCSFSQQFGLESEDTRRLFEKIRAHSISRKARLLVVLDTFYRADIFFGAPQEYVTTPKRLDRLVESFPEIDFVAAHMGGLAAPSQEVEEYLRPRNNLYLDTSNASTTLSRDEFVRRIHRHGPDRILFGTDWPWFSHSEEITRIGELLHSAGLSTGERSQIFSGNISRLLYDHPNA